MDIAFALYQGLDLTWSRPLHASMIPMDLGGCAGLLRVLGVCMYTLLAPSKAMT